MRSDRRSDPNSARTDFAASSPDAIITMPRIRRSLLCSIFGHKREYIRLWARGEAWATFIYLCRRCHRLLDGGHAARADKPVV